MSISWKNIDAVLVTICYCVGIGSILFGSLSGNSYGNYFVVAGILSLILACIHSIRAAV